VPDWGTLQVDQLRHMAREHGDQIAYRNLGAGTTLTFTEWDEQSNQLARFLVSRGIAKGDRVSVYLPSDEVLRWIVAYAAVHKAGAVAVPTNTRLTARELTTILGHAEIRAMFTCGDLLATANEVRGQVPSLDLIVTTGGAPADADPTSAETVDFDAARQSQDVADVQVPTTDDDLADIMYTSGTTGLPKGVAVRHRNVAMIQNNEPHWSNAGWLHGAPLFTFAGMSFIYNPMKMGLIGYYLPKFDATRWMELVEQERPPMAFIVPAMAELLVSRPDFEDHDLSSLVAVSIGSAPLAPSTQQRLQERLPGATVSNSYGMTEAGPAYIVMPKDQVTKRIGSVGKPTAPLEAKIVGEDGNEMPVGEVGQLLTRMPGRQREYYKDDAATESTWTPDGWLRSGDLGYIDADGYLYLVGRKKDLIIRGGNNVYPTDVEAAILEHPEVQEVAVIGVPHKILGEDIAAFVVRVPGSTLSAAQLKDFCAERLADYKRPREIHWETELPRNATGKVLKHQLKDPLGRT
jgi:acyl-CoA synthetase (AMP-forming)/AMP-acid ligase II